MIEVEEVPNEELPETEIVLNSIVIFRGIITSGNGMEIEVYFPKSLPDVVIVHCNLPQSIELPWPTLIP